MEFIYLINTKNNKFEKIKNNNIINEIYYLNYRFPTIQEIKKHTDASTFYKKNSIDQVKKNICVNTNVIPLFNIYHTNIYLIKKENVYYRVIYSNYRFIENTIINFIKYKHKKYINSNKIIDKVIKRKIRKLDLILGFIKQVDLKELHKLYFEVFYKYAPQIGNIVECKKPSFINVYQHLKPYYTRIELIRLAQNMNLKIKGDIRDPDNLDEICDQVTKYDINSNILLLHQSHMIKSNIVGLIKYYTIQGSYFINQYMRNLTLYKTINLFLENIIKYIWTGILTSPAFDKDYYLYRFVEDDYFINKLKIGDIYEESGFLSTTRDPFYRSDVYKFGFILIKIKIPKNKKGIGLCIETLSQFPEEQEIILPPKCRLKLIAKNKDFKYYHIDNEFSEKVKIKYEFEWIENLPLSFSRKKKIEQQNNSIDFLKLNDDNTFSLEEKIKIFINKYLNEMNGFNVLIGNKKFYLIGEWFDSIGTYERFYSLKTQSGFSIYTIIDKNILFMIEIAEINDERKMNVNYYLRYTNIIRNEIISEKDFIIFLSSIAYYFDIPNIIIYSDFITCDDAKLLDSNNIKQRKFSSKLYDDDDEKNDNNEVDEFINNIYYGGYYSYDIYKYLVENEKRFDNKKFNKIEIRELFSYSQLDLLHIKSPDKILKKEDDDELYQIYLRNFYPNNETNNKLSSFYLWIIKNYCYLTDKLISKMHRIYNIDNPFEKIVYSLNVYTYLYNNKLINSIPTNFVFNPVFKPIYKKNTDNYKKKIKNIKKNLLLK